MIVYLFLNILNVNACVIVCSCLDMSEIPVMQCILFNKKRTGQNDYPMYHSCRINTRRKNFKESKYFELYH